MDNITLGQISNLMVWVLGFGGSTIAIITAIKKAVASAFKPINSKIDNVDMNSTKNFLVRCIADMERHEIDQVTKMRFYEQYEHYQKLGGNSYITSEVERLKKEGKL